jgi:hypothetical protein
VIEMVEMILKHLNIEEKHIFTFTKQKYEELIKQFLDRHDCSTCNVELHTVACYSIKCKDDLTCLFG